MLVRQMPGAWSELTLAFPDDLDQALSLINRLFFINLSVVDTEGYVFGCLKPILRQHFGEDWKFENTTGRVILFTGEVRTEIAFADMEEAVLFLKGVYYAYYESATPDGVTEILSEVESAPTLEQIAATWIQRR